MGNNVLPFGRPIRWSALRADEAERVVRHLAEDTNNIGFGDHTFERIDDRSILQPDIYRILKTGYIEGQPEKLGNGDWKVTVVMRMPGTREAGVVTIILNQGTRLFVKTVEWMDWIR